MNNFIKERNEALLSLDKKKIIAYMKKYFGLEFINQFVVYIL